MKTETEAAPADYTQNQADRIVVELGELKAMIRELQQGVQAAFIAAGGPLAANHNDRIHHLCNLGMQVEQAGMQVGNGIVAPPGGLVGPDGVLLGSS